MLKKINVFLLIIVFCFGLYIIKLNKKIDVMLTQKKGVSNTCVLKERDYNIIDMGKINNRVLVETKQNLYIMPHHIIDREDIPIVNEISEKTIVNVLERVSIGDNSIWLRVSIPVYDTPMNNKGWIEEKNVSEYNDKNKKLALNGIIIKKNTKIYFTYSRPVNTSKLLELISDIQISEDVILRDNSLLEYDVIGKIENSINGYCNITIAGGEEFWVKEKDIVYP